MSWLVKDEWIDLALGRHVVIYHNPEVQVPVEPGHGTGFKPVEHHLINDFSVEACPHCGQINQRAKMMVKGENGEETEAPAVDFKQVKTDTLKALHTHHQKLMDYRNLHPHVRLDSGPKK